MDFLHKGNHFHYLDEGKGTVLVLLHGFTEDLTIWDDFSQVLREQFRVIRMDLPGHGQSDSIGPIHTMEAMAEIVHTLLQKLKVKKCVMIGHSMGGYATLSYAARYPSTLIGFGLFHSQAREDSQQARENRERTIALIRENRYNFLNQFIPDLFAQHNRKRFAEEIKKLQAAAEKLSPESLIANIEGMKRRISRLDVLSESRVPVLFIMGRKDLRIPFQDAMEQATLPQHTEILFLGNVAHMGYLEARDITLRKIQCFVNTCQLLSAENHSA